jgi:formate hydrogenlyase subunit 6/NADH:ubiquinone oxidoreductase subunit I
MSSFFVMAKTTLRSLFRKPVTTRYPAVPARRIPGSRGHIVTSNDDCIYCGICARRCPSGAIVVSRPEQTWKLDVERCVVCGSCVEVCSKGSLKMAVEHSGPIEPGAGSVLVMEPHPAPEKKAAEAVGNAVAGSRPAAEGNGASSAAVPNVRERSVSNEPAVAPGK